MDWNTGVMHDGPDVSGGTVVCTSVNMIIVKALGLYFHIISALSPRLCRQVIPFVSLLL